MNAKTGHSDEILGHSDENLGHVTGTFPRARAHPTGKVENVPMSHGTFSGGTSRERDRTSHSTSFPRDIPSHGTVVDGDLQIRVTPWPAYSDSGDGPAWEVVASGRAFNGTLRWSSRLGRFFKDDALARLHRRKSSAVARSIESAMVAAVVAAVGGSL